MHMSFKNGRVVGHFWRVVDMISEGSSMALIAEQLFHYSL